MVLLEMADTDKIALASLVVALVALAQPWLIWTWKRFVYVGTLEILMSGNPELGFSSWGPTITVNGTLAAVHQDIFVERLEVEIKNLDTQETHTFEWAAFRNPKFLLAEPDKVELELPASLLVTTSQPHRFAIFFIDRSTQEKMRPCLDKVVAENNEKLKGLPALKLQEEGGFEEALNRLDLLRQNPSQRSAYSKLNDLFYWKEGHYQLTVFASSRRPVSRFSASGTFSLSAADCESLSLNTVNITDAISAVSIGIPEPRFQFVNPMLTRS